MKINWKSIGAYALTTAGVVVAAATQGAYGPKAGVVAALLGSVLQAFTHPVAQSTTPQS